MEDVNTPDRALQDLVVKVAVNTILGAAVACLSERGVDASSAVDRLRDKALRGVDRLTLTSEIASAEFRDDLAALTVSKVEDLFAYFAGAHS